MSEYFAEMPASNSTTLCVGNITRSEAESARLDGFDVDGHGYYLFLAKQDDLKEPIQILAKFFTPLEAERVARIFHAKAIQAAFFLQGQPQTEMEPSQDALLDHIIMYHPPAPALRACSQFHRWSGGAQMKPQTQRWRTGLRLHYLCEAIPFPSGSSRNGHGIETAQNRIAWRVSEFAECLRPLPASPASFEAAARIPIIT